MALTPNKDVILVNIDKMISTMTRSSAAGEPFRIFRVPAHFKSTSNERYFEPRLVAIGPYHREKEHLRAMEEHKLRYFCDFTNKHPDRRERYVGKIRSLLPSLKKCYFESIGDLDDDAFAQMLLLDGCFILQFLIKLHNLTKENVPVNVEPSSSTQSAQAAQDASGAGEEMTAVLDTVFRVGWNFPLISTDMLMLENQIPFIVLQELYKIYLTPTAGAETSSNQSNSLHKLLSYFVSKVARTGREKKEQEKKEAVKPGVEKKEQEEKELDGIDHLLHFYYKAYVPAMEFDNNSNAPSENSRFPRMIPCATELREFGITFKKKNEPNNFLDISFKKGVLEIPYTTIEETTKTKYMNLVAFEQCSGIKNKNMSSYILFMDFLLNTRDDVIVLQRDGIIANKLANEDDVTKFFSQLNRCCYISFDKHYLAPVFRDIKEYCEDWWPKHRAKLISDYFSNPWVTISLCVAVFVLSITIFRTICFILSVFFNYNLN